MRRVDAGRSAWDDNKNTSARGLDLQPRFKLYTLVVISAKNSTNGLVTIGEAARSAGVATSVLRYYERVKLLKPAGRSDSGYRHYTSDDVARLRFIRAAQSIGFTLEDIRA